GTACRPERARPLPGAAAALPAGRRHVRGRLDQDRLDRRQRLPACARLDPRTGARGDPGDRLPPPGRGTAAAHRGRRDHPPARPPAQVQLLLRPPPPLHHQGPAPRPDRGPASPPPGPGRPPPPGAGGIITLAVPSLMFSYFSDLSQHFIDEAQRRGQTVVLHSTSAGPEAERTVLEGFQRIFGDGVIFNPLFLAEEQFAMMQ